MDPNEDRGDSSNLLALLLCNQQKSMAQSQVLMIQQARLIEHLTGHPALKIMEQGDELYRQELNKLQIANLAELRNLQGKLRTTSSGGGLEGAG